jgi:hypothetical protein
LPATLPMLSSSNPTNHGTTIFHWQVNVCTGNN